MDKETAIAHLRGVILERFPPRFQPAELARLAERILPRRGNPPKSCQKSSSRRTKADHHTHTNRKWGSHEA